MKIHTNQSNNSLAYILLFFTFLILILIEGFFCNTNNYILKLDSLGFCNKSFFLNFWSESGFIENLQVFFLFFSIIFLLKGRYLYRDIPFINIFLIIKILALLYFFGEEISWGQHFFRWNTPDIFKDINNQDETNIHNISNLFDQLPRTFVIIWCSLVAPITLIFNKKYGVNKKILKIFCPDANLKFISMMILFFVLPDLFIDILGLHPGHVNEFGQSIEASIFYDIITFNFVRLSEFHELIFTFYFLIYSLGIMKNEN
jgi:hypothetical protein